MIIATWNVNSLRVRLPHLRDWLAANPVDALALQETKLADPDFPREELQSLGLQVAYSGQRTYNGVALLARQALEDVLAERPAGLRVEHATLLEQREGVGRQHLRPLVAVVPRRVATTRINTLRLRQSNQKAVFKS